MALRHGRVFALCTEDYVGVDPECVGLYIVDGGVDERFFGFSLVFVSGLALGARKNRMHGAAQWESVHQCGLIVGT